MRILHLPIVAVVAISLGGQLLACGSYGSSDSGVSVRGADGDSADADDVNTGPAGNGAAESTQESDEDPTSGVARASGSSSVGDTSDGAGAPAGASTEVTSGSAPESSVGAVDDECPTEYDLPHYDGDMAGLCDPTESARCHCPTDAAAVSAPQCSPDGTECIMFGYYCVDFSQCGWSVADCPELSAALLGKNGTGSECITDRDCGEGHYCNQRVANRMFCDNVFVARAEDLCPKPQLDSGVADGGR